MPLSSTSTDEEVLAAYEDNCGYEASGSLAQAQQLIVACRILLLRLPKMTMVDAGLQMHLNVGHLTEELQRARRFVAASRTGGRAVNYDLRNCRD